MFIQLDSFRFSYIYSVEYGRVVDTKAGHDDASECWLQELVRKLIIFRKIKQTEVIAEPFDIRN